MTNEWKKKNKKHIQDYQKGWYRQNKKHVQDYQKEYYNNNKDKINKHRREYRQDNPNIRKAESLQRWYNITLEQHKQMYISQNGCCAICGKPVEYNKICTDHNHMNGQIRSLLCCKCNCGLHYIEDREYMKKALNYLEETKK